MRMLMSGKGEIKSEAEWHLWLNNFWESITSDWQRTLSVSEARKLEASNTEYTCVRPHDAWDRMVRILKLVEVKENHHEKSISINTWFSSNI